MARETLWFIDGHLLPVSTHGRKGKGGPGVPFIYAIRSWHPDQEDSTHTPKSPPRGLPFFEIRVSMWAWAGGRGWEVRSDTECLWFQTGSEGTGRGTESGRGDERDRGWEEALQSEDIK